MREPPEASYIGIGLAALSLIVMPVPARAKRQVTTNLKSSALEVDSRQTSICAYLSAILLVGLGLDAFFVWWRADPVVELITITIIA